MLFSSVLGAVALANVVIAQSPTGTASIIQIIPAEDGVQGQVIGTGSEGETTYRLFGTLGLQSLDIPFTATLVQNGSHMSEAAVIQGEGPGGASVSLVIQAACSFTDSGAQASCVQALVQPTATTSLPLTGAQTFTAVPILSGTAIPTFTSPTSGSASASGSESVLPPSLSTSAPSGSTATVVSGTSSAPSETTTSGASSRYSSIFPGIAWSLVLPIIFSYLASS